MGLRMMCSPGWSIGHRMIIHQILLLWRRKCFRLAVYRYVLRVSLCTALRMVCSIYLKKYCAILSLNGDKKWWIARYCCVFFLQTSHRQIVTPKQMDSEFSALSFICFRHDDGLHASMMDCGTCVFQQTYVSWNCTNRKWTRTWRAVCAQILLLVDFYHW